MTTGEEEAKARLDKAYDELIDSLAAKLGSRDMVYAIAALLCAHIDYLRIASITATHLRVSKQSLDSLRAAGHLTQFEDSP